MVKRKRAKASTAAKKKTNDKKKDAKPSNLEETTGENASISRSQNSVYDSSSIAKKAKFDPCQSPSPKKSKKYVPPFTASQRVSPRSRKSRINSEKSEKRQNYEQEITKVCLAAEHALKTEQGKANSPERSRKEVSEELLESNENKTDEKLCNKTSTDVQQSNVEMKIEITKEKDNETDAEEIAGENASEIAQKETSVEAQSQENSINRSRDENSATAEEIGEKNGKEVQEVGKVSSVAKALHHQIELSEGCEEGTRTDENLIGNKRENLDESVAEQLEKSADAQMSVVIGPERDHVETEVTIDGSDISARIDNVEARIGHFDARLSDFGGKINVATSVPFLSDVCVGNKCVSVIVEEPDKSESSQNKVQKTSESDSQAKINGTHKESGNGTNVNNKQGLAEEKSPNKNNNLLPELVQHRVADLDVTNKQTNFCEERTTDSFGHMQIQSSNEIDGLKGQKNLEPVQDEPMNKPSLFCQEIIEDKLSEMLAIVTESNNLPSSQITYKNNTNSSPTAENNEKYLGDPVHSTTVAEAEITSTENTCEKYLSDGQEKNCLKESVVTNKGFVDENLQDEGKRETSEVAVSVDSKCVSVMIEKVKDVGDKASSVDEYSDKRSQNAAKTEITEMKECQCETMSVDNEREQISTQKVEDLGKSGKSDKNSLNTPATETESKVPSSERSETIDKVGNNADKITAVLVASDKVINENDQEVPGKMSTSPEQEVPDETLSKIALTDENNVVSCNHNEATSSLVRASESSTACISHNTSKTLETTEKTVDVITSGSIDEQSYAEEFRALEELLPADDIGLFDDVMMIQTKSTSVNNELPSGNSTIEFLINELKSLHCMVASYERAVRDVKRQYDSNARF